VEKVKKGAGKNFSSGAGSTGHWHLFFPKMIKKTKKSEKKSPAEKKAISFFLDCPVFYRNYITR
jgi:hypothetical protein